MLVTAEPELTSEERLAVARATTQFNRGSYFECHETLEAVWLGLLGPSRDFFQALIQVSVGFHHLERRNRAGALKTFARASDRFEPYPARYFGFDVAAERARLQALVAALKRGESDGPGPPPIWRFDDLPVVEGKPGDAPADGSRPWSHHDQR
jgi:predicted metal-dependent hydrolase